MNLKGFAKNIIALAIGAILMTTVATAAGTTVSQVPAVINEEWTVIVKINTEYDGICSIKAVIDDAFVIFKQTDDGCNLEKAEGYYTSFKIDASKYDAGENYNLKVYIKEEEREGFLQHKYTRTHLVSEQNFYVNNIPTVKKTDEISIEEKDEITFTINAIDTSDDVLTYYFNFDGANIESNTSSMEYTYETAGEYEINYYVRDSYNEISKLKATKVIVSENQAPVIESMTVSGTDMLKFITEVSDKDEPVSIVWNFGDEEIAEGTEVSHEYDEEGVYNVTVTATDSKGASSTDSTYVVVLGTDNNNNNDNEAPTADFEYDCEKLTCEFEDKSTDSDGTIASREWHFGDDLASTSANTTHTYSEDGTYSVKLVVIDNDGNQDSKTVLISVSEEDDNTDANNEPTAITDSTLTVNVSKYASFYGTATDSDGTIILYEWDFDYNASEEFERDWSSTVSGITSHKYTKSGTYKAVLRVTDNELAQNEATVIVTVRATDDYEEDDEKSGEVDYDFDNKKIEVVREYKYDEEDDETTITLQISNLKNAERTFLVRDVVPSEFAEEREDIDKIKPAYDVKYDETEFGWNVTLGAYEDFSIEYTFEGYVSLEDMEDNFDEPKITEYVAVEATEEETESAQSTGLTGFVLGAFSGSYGIWYFLIIVALIFVFWKKEAIVSVFKKK